MFLEKKVLFFLFFVIYRFVFWWVITMEFLIIKMFTTKTIMKENKKRNMKKKKKEKKKNNWNTLAWLCSTSIFHINLFILYIVYIASPTLQPHASSLQSANVIWGISKVLKHREIMNVLSATMFSFLSFCFFFPFILSLCFS